MFLKWFIVAFMTSENSTPASSLIDDNFGASLRYWRELRDITQEDLSKRMRARGFDFHQSTLYKIESGKRRVLLGEGVALAELLQVPLDRLTSPQVGTEPAILAQIKLGARLELDALERARDALTDLRMANTGLVLNLKNLNEPEAIHDFDGVKTTAQEFYKPLTECDVKPAVKLLSEIGEKTEHIAKFLGL